MPLNGRRKQRARAVGETITCDVVEWLRRYIQMYIAMEPFHAKGP
jgi:hypothetical protein